LRVKLITLLCSLLFAGGTYGQVQQYQFDRIGLKEGLLQENTHATQQDSKGYLWISSGAFLQRYDGQRFLNFFYRKGDKNSIPPGNINYIAIDKKNRLWLQTGNDNIGYFNLSDFTYHPARISLPPGYGGRRINGVIVTHDNKIILAYAGYNFITYSEKTNTFSLLNNEFNMPEGYTLTHFWQDKNFNYWVGCQEGIVKYNAKTKQLSYSGHNEENDPVINQFGSLRNVTVVFVDRSNTAWIMAWPNNALKLISFEISSKEVKDWVPVVSNALKNVYYVIFSIVEVNDGSLWFSGGNIMARVDKKNFAVHPVTSSYQGENSLRFDNINYMTEDREHNVWLNTNKGLYRFNPGSQKFFPVSLKLPGRDTLYTPDVTDFLETDDGKILVGTWGNGLFAYDQQFNPVKESFSEKVKKYEQTMVWCITKRKNGDIWTGLQHGHLFQSEDGGKKISFTNPEIFENSTIRQIVEDHDGNMWLGTQRGFLVKWHADTRKYELIHKFQSIIGRLMVDSENNIWVCTDLRGVHKINSTDGRILETYTNEGFEESKGLPFGGASDIVDYNDSTIVIASQGLNFLHKKKKTFRYYTREIGLPSENIFNMVVDKEGYIWMSTSAGISSFHPVRKRISIYNASDGVHTNTYNVASSGLLKDGRVLFGSNHDFLVFDPRDVTVEDINPPKIQLAGIAVMNKELNVDSLLKLPKIELKHYEHSLKIDLSSLTFQNQFFIYYRMEGLSNEWISAGKLNQVVFTYLKPGTYKFEVGCKDDDGVVKNLTTVEFFIRSPFWKTWWFYAGLLLIAGALFYWLDRQRMRRKEIIPKMRNDIATNLHQEINLALSNINILSEIAKMKADKEPEKSKEFIEQISAKSNNMMIAMDDMLWSINPENDSMQKTIERMQEYVDALNIRHETDIQIFIDKKVDSLQLNMRSRYDILHFFKEYLTGLVNAGARQVLIHLSYDRPSLLFTIEIDNKNFDQQKLQNLLHRQDLTQRLELIQGRMNTQLLMSTTIILLNLPTE
jgi:ligand-binding sensor domain-containing protein